MKVLPGYCVLYVGRVRLLDQNNWGQSNINWHFGAHGAPYHDIDFPQ